MKQQRGMTLVEVLAVLAVMGLGMGAATMFLRPAEAPLETAVALTQATLQQGRLRAMASTSAFRVQPNVNRLLTQTAARCTAGTWSAVDEMEVRLPDRVTISNGWSVCFSPRGLSSTNVTIDLSHPEFGMRQVEVMLGGTTRELP